MQIDLKSYDINNYVWFSSTVARIARGTIDIVTCRALLVKAAAIRHANTIVELINWKQIKEEILSCNDKFLLDFK